MRSRTLCLILSGWLLHSASYALELPKLPFLGNKTQASIELKGHPKLSKLLEEELDRQRENNRQLKQYTKRSKIGRYESQLLTERLRAEGYYAAQIKVEQHGEHIKYRVDPGPIYTIRKLAFKHPEHVTTPQTLAGLESGAPLRAAAVLEGKKALTSYIADNFCLYRIDVSYRVIVEHQTQTADVTYLVEDSPSVSFGDISFTGLQSIDQDYLTGLLPLKPGACFKPTHIDAARLTLIQTNLLTSISAEVEDPVDGIVPINLRVIERRHRRVSAGVGFQSDEGFGVSAGWEHRNLMGRAQKLTVDGHIAENAQSLSSSLTLPHFRRNDQSLTFYADLEHEDTDAFESETGGVGVELSRHLRRNLRGVVGADLTFSKITEDGVEDTFALLSVPLTLEYDRRNDPLDPRSGWVASGQVRPYWDAYDTGTKFVKSTVAASAYFTFDDVFWRPTLAVRSAIGSINGVDRDQVPANIRFYTGGGGSVRGYPFQTLGPLTDDEPDGGLSFTEFSVETRFRWSEDWGGVVFLDGGFAYEEEVPQFGQDLRWGAGVGLRYYTSFAPIRVDIGVPLDKRKGVDDDYQLYISIGQAF